MLTKNPWINRAGIFTGIPACPNGMAVPLSLDDKSTPNLDSFISLDDWHGTDIFHYFVLAIPASEIFMIYILFFNPK